MGSGRLTVLASCTVIALSLNLNGIVAHNPHFPHIECYFETAIGFCLYFLFRLTGTGLFEKSSEEPSLFAPLDYILARVDILDQV